MCNSSIFEVYDGNGLNVPYTGNFSQGIFIPQFPVGNITNSTANILIVVYNLRIKDDVSHLDICDSEPYIESYSNKPNATKHTYDEGDTEPSGGNIILYDPKVEISFVSECS